MLKCVSELFSLKRRYAFHYHAQRCGTWYIANQNTEEDPWAGVHESADLGRFLYEVKLPSMYIRGNGVWGQACGIMGLLALHTRTGDPIWLERARMAGDYLLSLQVLDFRKPHSIGGFREHSPQAAESYPRDAATGALGLLALYRETGNDEYLERAKIFADWWLQYGTDENNWPYISFDLENGVGTNRPITVGGEEETVDGFIPGVWQSGSGLFLYELAALTGERRYIDEGLVPLLDRAVLFFERNDPTVYVEGFHGHTEVLNGNDDFATTALMAGFLACDNRLYLDTAVNHIRGNLAVMDENGGFPGFGGTFITALNMANLLELNEAKDLGLDLDDVAEALVKTAEYGLGLQEVTSRDRRLFGGLYGQSDYGLGRHWIHHRSTAYSLLLYLRLEGRISVPWMHCLHWKE